MASSNGSADRRGSRYARRIALFAGAIVLAIAAYSAAWHYFARQVEREARDAIAALNRDGLRAHCEELEAKGYPFRIGIFCRSLYYEDVNEGVSVRTGAFRSAAQIYQPARVVGEIDGPAAIVLPFGPAVELDWRVLRASARIATPLPNIFSSEGKDLVLARKEGAAGTVATASRTEFHARPAENDLQFAARFDDLAPGEAVAIDLPAVSGSISATLEDGVGRFLRGERELHGSSWQIDELLIGEAGGGARLSVSGTVSVGENGLIDAELRIEANEPARIATLAGQAFPPLKDQLEAASGLIAGLAGQPLPLRIKDGRVSLGFVRLGQIPAI
ncbi:DUF2125 domain-containing protein [Nitratireductor thuwali]|uniref:DUF2125 domain-containing protein n=1 Tax=Nitratireductor thuwali TaxID=2267699 RepID=A0ABY5MJD4_9HYPH|nr:hypothetical protein NTH_01645 [Nitratireductor thuwali]